MAWKAEGDNVKKFWKWLAQGWLERGTPEPMDLPQLNHQWQQVSLVPALDKALATIRKAVLDDANHEGGPCLEKTMELVIDCTDDPILRKVLTVKGGKLGIVLHLGVDFSKIDATDEFRAAMAQQRQAAGIN